MADFMKNAFVIINVRDQYDYPDREEVVGVFLDAKMALKFVENENNIHENDPKSAPKRMWEHFELREVPLFENIDMSEVEKQLSNFYQKNRFQILKFEKLKSPASFFGNEKIPRAYCAIEETFN